MRGMQEPTPVQDVFCSGLGAIEKIGGGCVRLYWYVMQSPDGSDGPPEQVLVAKLIFPASAIPDSVMQIISAVSNAGAALVSAPFDELMH